MWQDKIHRCNDNKEIDKVKRVKNHFSFLEVSTFNFEKQDYLLLYMPIQ